MVSWVRYTERAIRVVAWVLPEASWMLCCCAIVQEEEVTISTWQLAVARCLVDVSLRGSVEVCIGESMG